MSSTMRVPLLFGFVLVMHHYMASSLLAQAKPSDEISFNVSSGSKQTVYMHKICVNSTLDNAAVLTTVRESTVQFNMMQSMYRDGKLIAVYKLDRPGHQSLAGCANACILNWRLHSSGNAWDTDCSESQNSHCPMTSGVIIADRMCEAFVFNRLTSSCSLFSSEQPLKLRKSKNKWSGTLKCSDVDSIHDWASSVVGRMPPSPPPPPPPPPPAYRYIRWTITNLKGPNPNSVQASQINLYIQNVLWTVPDASVSSTNPGGRNPVGEEPKNLVDGSVLKKWLDFNIISGSSITQSIILIDLSVQKSVTGYNWYTANDVPERDPISWTLEGSTDSSSWVLLDSVQNYPTTDTRFALAYTKQPF